uniref:Ig-like domain-containing protein n=1 Tax=Cyprinus carpio TaxID=7962 RepID=A0A8C1ME37_CYPCA
FVFVYNFYSYMLLFTLESITAVLGHSVTFRCSSKHSTPAERCYIQRVKNNKEEEFISGFYRGQPIPVSPEYRNRTKVNVTELSMEMRNISVSDEGLYKCFVFINNKAEISEILLKVTAEYSVPTITKDCNKPGDGGAGKSCQLSCSAVGGYPQSTVRWTGLNQSLTNVIYSRSSADNKSKTWTINQTIVHNCNQPTNISCAVGGSVSHTITICKCVVGFCSITHSKWTFLGKLFRCYPHAKDPILKCKRLFHVLKFN